MNKRLVPHVLPLLLALIAIGCALSGNNATLELRYERAAIEAGQVWRLITGNLVHLGWPHLAMNLAGLLLIWVIFFRDLVIRQWTTVVAVSACAVGVGLYLFNTQLNWYVGLSGILHGLLIAPLVMRIRRGYRFEWLILLALCAKLGWEQWAGAVPGSAEMAGGNVVVDAHLYGAIGGLLVALLVKPAPQSANDAPA
jgi:rhomboid family GlyGly-CTERM serine protease